MIVQRRLILFTALALLISACANTASGLTPATIANDEGGPVAVEGEMRYTNGVVAQIYEVPTALLFDVGRELRGDYSELTPPSGQILGVMTSPIAPSPAGSHVNLPIAPTGAAVDMDNNGHDDAGVQVCALLISTVVVGGASPRWRPGSRACRPRWPWRSTAATRHSTSPTRFAHRCWPSTAPTTTSPSP